MHIFPSLCRSNLPFFSFHFFFFRFHIPFLFSYFFLSFFHLFIYSFYLVMYLSLPSKLVFRLFPLVLEFCLQKLCSLPMFSFLAAFSYDISHCFTHALSQPNNSKPLLQLSLQQLSFFFSSSHSPPKQFHQQSILKNTTERQISTSRNRNPGRILSKKV